jgi:tetratricopeptide (TPR) repeat protein
MTGGRLALAFVALLASPARAGDDPKALLDSGAALERAGDWDRARAVYEKLEHVSGHAGEALYLQARMAFETADDAVALGLAERAAKVAGAHQPLARMLYADVLVHEGEYKRAKEIYLVLRRDATGAAHEIATRKITACNRALGLALDDGIAAPASTAPPAAVPAKTTPPAPAKARTAQELLRDGKAAERANKWNEARAIYEQLERDAAHRAEALYGEAWAAYQLGDNDAALALAEKAAKEPGAQREQALVLAGDVHFKRGDYRRAKDLYVELRKQTKSDDLRAVLAKKIALANNKLQLPAD